MPPTYKQGTRHMMVTTPLGEDTLLLVGFTGIERMSGLYQFNLELVAKNTAKIEFDKILGQDVGVTMLINSATSANAAPGERYFRGICRRFAQGDRDEDFTYYRA